MTVTQTQVEPIQSDSDLLPYEEDGDPNAKAHIVRPGREDMNAQDVVDLARLTGAEVTALCGHKWIPKRNPNNKELCKTCVEIWDRSQ